MVLTRCLLTDNRLCAARWSGLGVLLIGAYGDDRIEHLVDDFLDGPMRFGDPGFSTYAGS
jgi:hypothetical protein